MVLVDALQESRTGLWNCVFPSSPILNEMYLSPPCLLSPLWTPPLPHLIRTESPLEVGGGGLGSLPLRLVVIGKETLSHPRFKTISCWPPGLEFYLFNKFLFGRNFFLLGVSFPCLLWNNKKLCRRMRWRMQGKEQNFSFFIRYSRPKRLMD